MNRKQGDYLYSLVYPITRNQVIARKIVLDVLRENKNPEEKTLVRQAINRAIEAGKDKIG